MRTAVVRFVVLLSALVSLGSGTARADLESLIDRANVSRFATLPSGVRFPEGLAVNPANRDVYVGTFDFGPNRNALLRFNRHGQLLAQRDFGATPLLGLAFAGGKVYIANFGASKVQRMPAAFNASTPIEDVATLPDIGAPLPRVVDNPDGSTDTVQFGSNHHPAPNGLLFDRAGNLYVSDTFQGAIFRIENATTCTTPCSVTTVIHDPLLATAGFPPFGANGLALNADESVLYVANTGDDRVLKYEFGSHKLTVFAESINGADGLVMDGNGRLWVAANQSDEIVGLNASGRVVARLGDFSGIKRDGTPEGLLFPASVVIVDDDMFVTNLALPLTPAVGDEPEEDVTRWTIARLKVPHRP